MLKQLLYLVLTNAAFPPVRGYSLTLRGQRKNCERTWLRKMHTLCRNIKNILELLGILVIKGKRIMMMMMKVCGFSRGFNRKWRILKWRKT